MKYTTTSLFRLFSVSTLSLALILQAGPSQTVSAATGIGTRELVLKAGSTDGGSLAGGSVTHEFNFTLQDTSNLGSVKFQYCTTAAPVPDGIDCDSPAGVSTENANLSNQSGEVTGFTGIDQGSEDDDATGTFNTIIISRGSAQPISDGDSSGGIEASFEFTQVINPSTPNETFFVRVSTYGSLDGTGSAIESGTVAASTANPIELDGTMPESLVFCTGRTIDLTGGVPDCTTATSGAVSFDQLFSPTDTATASSQMAASTNAGAGYAITVNGPTLTSGSNTIVAMDDGSGGPTGLVLGTSQFGMNLVANTTTTDVNGDPLGLDAAPVANGTNYRGQPATDYAAPDTYEYSDGEVVANSYNGGAGGSDSQIFTASYVVNVPGSQPAGTYTTTLTYICTATF